MLSGRFRLPAFAMSGSLLIACAACSPPAEQGNGRITQEIETVANPVLHFEIPVSDMDRAAAFYEHVFGYELKRQRVDDYEMAFFPRSDTAPGASGALALGDVYRPSKEGAIIYFDVPDIDTVLARATERGGEVLYEKKDIGKAGFVAEFEDSEGNRIALTQGAD